jgi:hypothetical protein
MANSKLERAAESAGVVVGKKSLSEEFYRDLKAKDGLSAQASARASQRALEDMPWVETLQAWW